MTVILIISRVTKYQRGQHAAAEAESRATSAPLAVPLVTEGQWATHARSWEILGEREEQNSATARPTAHRTGGDIQREGHSSGGDTVLHLDLILRSNKVTRWQRTACTRPWSQRHQADSSCRIRIQLSGYSCRPGDGAYDSQWPVTTALKLTCGERIARAGVLLNPRGHNHLPLRDEGGTKKTKTDVLETLVRLPGRLAERPARVACPIAGEPRATHTVPCPCWGILSSRSMGRVE